MRWRLRASCERSQAGCGVSRHSHGWGKATGFGERDVRRVLVQRYEVRYEVTGSDIYVLRVFHTRGIDKSDLDMAA